MSTTRDRRKDRSEEEEMRRRRISREIVRVESEIEEGEEEEDDDEDEESDPKGAKEIRKPKHNRVKKQSDKRGNTSEDELEDDDEEGDDEESDDEDEDEDEGDEEDNDGEEESKSLWQHIVTGGFIAGDNATQYYRYLIAIALMCFISIFLTFMSLNADDEYRRKEKRLTLLRERSILKSEERYRISSREEVVRRLDKEFGITMIEQKNSQRMQ
jgi:hypothetical protein